MAKHIFVTGGVVSSLGKGLTSASIGMLLERRGLKVRMQKFDPYLNVDPGTMSPYQHGEVYVLDDGAETDLDLGHYERFTNAPLVVTQVEVRLRPVVEHVHLAVLVGAHRARIDIQIRIEFLHPDLQPASLQEHPDRRRGQPFAEGTDHAAGNEYVLRHVATVLADGGRGRRCGRHWCPPPERAVMAAPPDLSPRSLYR